MAKLTLSVDSQVVSRAKRYAKQRGLAVSKMVEAYLAAVAEPAAPVTREVPTLRSLRGSLKRADIEAYRSHLVTKYR
jgi:antitoxin component of RelBE/YafQ-DinJ toxin-antitoxin module